MSQVSFAADYIKNNSNNRNKNASSPIKSSSNNNNNKTKSNIFSRLYNTGSSSTTLWKNKNASATSNSAGKSDPSVSSMMYHHHSHRHLHDKSVLLSRKDYKRLWKKAFNIVLFIVRSKFIYIRERATKLTRFEEEQIKAGFTNFVSEVSPIYVDKVGDFFHSVGVSIISNDGEQDEGRRAGLQALEKSSKGTASIERLMKTELSLSQILKIAQQLKKSFAESVISEEELAFEAVREWMDLKNSNKKSAGTLGDSPVLAPVSSRGMSSAAHQLRNNNNNAALLRSPDSFNASSSPSTANDAAIITESDVHDCLVSFGVAPGNFTEAGIKEGHHHHQHSRRHHHQYNVSMIRKDTTNNTSTSLLDVGGGEATTRARKSSVRIVDEDDEDDQHNNTTSTTNTSARDNNNNMNVSGALVSLKPTTSASSHHHGPTMMMSPTTSMHNMSYFEKPPPSKSPLPLSTFREVFFQQKGPLNKMQRLMALNQQQEMMNHQGENDGGKNQNAFEATLGLLGQGGGQQHSPSRRKNHYTPTFGMSTIHPPTFSDDNNNNNNTSGAVHNNKNHSNSNNPDSNNKSNNNSGEVSKNHQDAANNNNNNSNDATSNFINSLLNGGDPDHAASMNPNDSEMIEESENERISRLLKSIRVRMDLPPTLSLDARPIEASYDMRDWRERKEMQKLNSAKNRFDTDADVGKGTGVRVLPTKLGNRIIQESLLYKQQVAKATDDALLRAVEKNVTKAIVDRAAVQAKSRASTYRRTKEEEDAAKEFIDSKKSRFIGSGGNRGRRRSSSAAAVVTSLTPEPSSGSGGNSSMHLRTIKGLASTTPDHNNNNNQEDDDEENEDNLLLPSWLRRARNRRNFVPFMARPIPRSDLSRHLRESLPRKSPSELSGGLAFALSDEQRMQLGNKMMQDQQELQRELMMQQQQEQQQQQQQQMRMMQHGDARMAASVLLDVLEARKRDEEMQSQNQQHQSQQNLLSAPQQPEWANNNNNNDFSYSNSMARPRAGSVPVM